jgi:gamma-glutamyltranspeptidase/glutathione hydrolase
VFRDGALWGVLGTPGADNQVQVNVQVLTAMIDLGADPQTAIELPRWTSSQPGQGANWPHEGDGRLTIERDVGDEVIAGLEARGHRLTLAPHLGGPCAMQAIRVLENGVRMAGSDTRRDGWAGAY